MKKIYFLTLFVLFACITHAQINVQGVFRSEVNITQKPQKMKNTTFNMDDIVYWVGTGENKAALVIQWNDPKNPDALVWGFRWDGNATGEDMVKAIAKVDKRFYTLMYQDTEFGSTIGGLGFNLDGKGTVGLYKNNNTTFPHYPLDGVITTLAYDFDDYKGIDPNDHWQSGWDTGYWSYWLKEEGDANFDYAGSGASGRLLKDGSWDLWSYNPDMVSQDIASTFTPVSSYKEPADFTKGFFIVNEEWFGHANGSVNFVDGNGDVHYRVYSEKNNNEAFGATTTFGTIYGDKFYFVSKQDKDKGDINYTPGGRLVVTNAKTMEKITSFDTIGGDGRSFLGVDASTGYIGASNGIYLFDIDNMQVGSLIAGTGSTGQIGNMIRTSQYVFAVKQKIGVLVIDPISNVLSHTIPGTFHSITQAKDGSIWAIQNQKLVNIHPTTFTTTEYAIPSTKYLGSWSAWNAGSFTYSNKENALFWINSINDWTPGNKIVKFDVSTKTINESFAILPGQTGAYKQIPYGSALRIDPLSGNLIINTTESGYGAHYQKNWVHTFNEEGHLMDTKVLNDYYWFPAVTVFPDVDSPMVTSDLPSAITAKEIITIDLKNKVTDVDNLSQSIVKTILSNSNPLAATAEINKNDELVITPKGAGTTDLIIAFNSNGKIVTHKINVSGSTLSTNNMSKIDLKIYPNPTTDFVNIKTSDEVREIQLFDYSGKGFTVKLTNDVIDIRHLQQGNYIILIKTDKAIYQRKLIKN